MQASRAQSPTQVRVPWKAGKGESPKVPSAPAQRVVALAPAVPPPSWTAPGRIEDMGGKGGPVLFRICCGTQFLPDNNFCENCGRPR